MKVKLTIGEAKNVITLNIYHFVVLIFREQKFSYHLSNYNIYQGNIYKGPNVSLSPLIMLPFFFSKFIV